MLLAARFFFSACIILLLIGYIGLGRADLSLSINEEIGLAVASLYLLMIMICINDCLWFNRQHVSRALGEVSEHGGAQKDVVCVAQSSGCAAGALAFADLFDREFGDPQL